MHLELKDQQLEATLFIYRLLYQNLTVTTKQKSTIDTHKKVNQHKHNIEGSHQTIRKQNIRGREGKRPTKTNLKQLTKQQPEHMYQ